MAGLPDVVSYNFHVKPILADRCFSCHGPDAARRKAELRLDQPGWKATDLAARLLSTDPEYLMPPPESHLSVTAVEKATLFRWLDQGAQYEAHWAFQPLRKNESPTLSGLSHPVDQFVRETLQSRQIVPSPRASKETLLRRISFDLRGLPPSLAERADFLADTQPDAYERQIDAFLASDSYGERMAAHWMDLARFTDSDGYLDDKHRDFSPWRDWVIDAFNQNMPYDQFVSWQLAGDLYPNASQEQILATAFNRLHKKNSEAGIVFEEYRVEYVADRTQTFGKAFLGLTVECARCHDHKYDPLSQQNYYELFAFFNSTHELGHAVYGPDQTPGPALLLTDAETEAKRAFLEQNIQAQEAQLAETSGALTKEVVPKINLKKALQKDLVAHLSFEQINGTNEQNATTPNLARTGAPARLHQAQIQAGKHGNAFFVSDYNTVRLPDSVGNFERSDPFSVSLWVYPDTVYKEASLFTHCEDFRLGFKGYALLLRDNHLQFHIAHSWPQNALQVLSSSTLPVRQWSQITLTYDGSSKASGVKLFVDGEPMPTEIELDHLYKGIRYEKDIHTYGYRPFQLGYRDKLIPFKKGGLDELRIYRRELSPLEVLGLFDLAEAQQLLRQSPEHALVRDHYCSQMHPEMLAQKERLHHSRARLTQLMNAVPEIMVMGDLPEPRPTFVLERGNYDRHGEAVSPQTPQALLPFPATAPPNRLGLVQWLFDPRHPLTARVIVNRIWAMHFGTGIVETTEDFGSQGAFPSHPALLDWLAHWLIQNQWDLKALHRLILTSETYQQSSRVRPELAEIDPENRLLARGPRFRLPAEMIRDNALALSGLLVPKTGGPSVYPYQPEGLWDELSNKSWRYPYLQKPGEGLYRRSLYTIWKRTAPPPAMQIFDIANRDLCTVRRKETSTPLQALVLLNDPQYQEAARKIAERIFALEPMEIAAQMALVFQIVLGREGSEVELERILAFYLEEKNWYEQHPEEALAYLSVGASEWNPILSPASLTALGLTINSLMNTAEAYTRN